MSVSVWGIRALSLCGGHTGRAGVNIQQTSGVGTSSLIPQPCVCGGCSLYGASACQDGLVCGVHYRACDSSRCGEQCDPHQVAHIGLAYVN